MKSIKFNWNKFLACFNLLFWGLIILMIKINPNCEEKYWLGLYALICAFGVMFSTKWFFEDKK